MLQVFKSLQWNDVYALRQYACMYVHTYICVCRKRHKMNWEQTNKPLSFNVNFDGETFGIIAFLR